MPVTALKDENFCYFHHNRRKRPSPKNEAYEPYIAPQDTAHELTPLDDADATQLALSDVVLALAANRIDFRRDPHPHLRTPGRLAK